MSVVPDVKSIDGFSKALTQRGRSPQTATLYARQIVAFQHWDDSPEAAIGKTADAIARWLNSTRGQGLSASTVRQRLAAARAWLTYLGEDLGPLGDYKAPPLPPPDPTPLPGGMADVQAMIDITPDQCMKNVIALCGYAGLRISEAITLQVGALEQTKRRIRVTGKGDKERIVPMSEKLHDVLAQDHLVAEGPGWGVVSGGIGDSSARKRITRIAYNAGLIDVSSHDLRATFATELFKATKDVLLVSKLLGHSSIATTQAYLGFDTDAAAEAVNAL